MLHQHSLHHHRVVLNGVRLHYAEAPGPGPALVIVHGLTGSYAEFLHLVPKLAGQAHVYLLDLRGHGLSAWTDNGYLVADYSHDVAAFLEEVVGRPALLLGHSLGGVVATWLATYTPHLLQGVLLEDIPNYILPMSRFRQTGFYTYFADLREYLTDYHDNGSSLSALETYIGQAPVGEGQVWLDVVGANAVRERAIQLHQVDPTTIDPVLTGALLGPHEPDELLARIRCPVHLVAADSSLGAAMEPQDVARAVAMMPHCTHIVVKGAGHDIHLDQPQAFLQELRWFLQDIGVADTISGSEPKSRCPIQG